MPPGLGQSRGMGTRSRPRARRDVGSSGVETVLVAGDGAAAEQGVDELS
jgi:hypothetical protein